MFTGWAALAALLVEGGWLVGLVLVEVAFGLAWKPEDVRLFHHPRFWAFILAAVALGPFLIGEPNVTLGPLRLSREGLDAGLEMAGRVSALAMALGWGLASLSLSDVVAMFGQLGLRGLGFAVALAMNLLGTLREMATVTVQTIWLRGGRRRPLVALRLFLVTVVANTLGYGDEVINAASVRAFDPNKGQPVPLPLRRADLWLLIMLAAYTGVLLVASTR